MSQGQQGKSTQQHISNDFVPTSMVRGSNNLKESEDQLARLIGLTNENFKDLGVSTSYGKRTTGPTKSDMCGGCSREIIGKVINALDQTWHPACFQCSQCAKPIELSQNSSFIVRGGSKAWCNKCDEWDRKEKAAKKGSANSGAAGNGNGAGAGAGNGSSVAAKNAEIARKNAAQQEAHDNIQAGKEMCEACGKAILGEAVDYKSGTVQQYFHVACFQCAHCRKPVDNVVEGFQHYKGKIYHPACYKQVIGHGPCGGCGQNITTKYVVPEPGGPKFHSNCFVCSVASCKTPLASGFMMHDGKAYCSKCANERFSSSTNITGNRITGFKVDPMTHKKISTETFTQAGQGSSKTTTTTTVGTGAHPTTTSTTKTTGAAAAGAGAGRKFCTNCGTASSGGKFCGQCGTPL